MRITTALFAVISAVALAGCCNGPVGYVECINSGIQIDIVDELGNPVMADAVTYQVNDRKQRYAHCIGAMEEDEEVTTCESYWIQHKHDATYTIEIWADSQLVTTEVVEARTSESKSGECCGDVFSEQLTIEIPTEST